MILSLNKVAMSSSYPAVFTRSRLYRPKEEVRPTGMEVFAPKQVKPQCQAHATRFLLIHLEQAVS
jgi:hypothetical protein